MKSSLTFDNAYAFFIKRKFARWNYYNQNSLSTTCQIEFINRNKFAKAILNKNLQAFVIHFSPMVV